MEIYKLLFWSLSIIWNFTNCKAQDLKLYPLKVIESEINKVIKEIVVEESQYVEIEKEIGVIRLEKNVNEIEIRIGTLTKKLLYLYLSGKNDNPVGFFNFEGVDFIVFGDNTDILFSKDNDNKDVLFLEVEPKPKIKKGIPPPPLVFEPIVWIYTYKLGKLELISKGRHYLLR